jgi:hypothetical protein
MKFDVVIQYRPFKNMCENTKGGGFFWKSNSGSNNVTQEKYSISRGRGRGGYEECHNRARGSTVV